MLPGQSMTKAVLPEPDMIGDFEYTINDKTPEDVVRKWNELISFTGCSIAFEGKNPFPVLDSNWKLLDFSNIFINYVYSTRSFRAIHKPQPNEYKQNKNFSLIYTDTKAYLNHYDRKILIPSESFVLIDHASYFDFDMDEDQSHGISLNLNINWLLKYIPNPKLSVALPIRAQDGWGAVLLQALRTIEQCQDPENTIPRGLIAEQLGSLLSLLILPREGGKLESRHQIATFSKLNRILHEYFHVQDLSPADVAQKAGISRRHLFNIFSKADVSFSNTLLQIRLNNAHKMLRDKRYKSFRICDIAWASGFSDLSHFNKHFRENFKLTPSGYRKKTGNDIGT